MRDNNLQNWPHQIDKVKQFYNQIMVRHGIMLVGPTGGGKTTVRTILQKALILMPTIVPQDEKENVTRKQSLFPVSSLLECAWSWDGNLFLQLHVEDVWYFFFCKCAIKKVMEKISMHHYVFWIFDYSIVWLSCWWYWKSINYCWLMFTLVFCFWFFFSWTHQGIILILCTSFLGE